MKLSYLRYVLNCVLALALEMLTSNPFFYH